MFPNKYPGKCDKCQEQVDAYEGFAVKLWGRNAPRVMMQDGSGRYKRFGNRNQKQQLVTWHVRCSRCTTK